MARPFLLGTEIVPCPIVRDRDGLALSSRNSRLAPAARAVAAEFPRILFMGAGCDDIRKRLEAAGFEAGEWKQG